MFAVILIFVVGVIMGFPFSVFIFFRFIFEAATVETTGLHGAGHSVETMDAISQAPLLPVFVFKSDHCDQIACSLLGGFSKPRTAATQSLDSVLCSMLI